MVARSDSDCWWARFDVGFASPAVGGRDSARRAAADGQPTGWAHSVTVLDSAHRSGSLAVATARGPLSGAGHPLASEAATWRAMLH